MKLLKYLVLCLSVSVLLISCGGHEPAPAPTEPTLTQGTTPATTATEANACQATPDAGPCKAQIEKFFFDPATKKCASFTYGGCQGTVPFETMESCQSACEIENKSAAIGCEVNGTEYNVGDSWAQACNTCTCTSTENGPSAVCTDTPCDMSTTPNDTQQSPVPSDAAPATNPNAQGA